MEADKPQGKNVESALTNWMLGGAIVTLLLTMFLLPMFLHHRLPPRRGCLQNLKSIEGAKSAWMQEHAKTTNDTPTETEIFGRTNYIIFKPICPGGGTYLIGKVGEKPRCSIPGHVLE